MSTSKTKYLNKGENSMELISVRKDEQNKELFQKITILPQDRRPGLEDLFLHRPSPLLSKA